MEALGERRIIELILEQVEKMPNMQIPFGDDVAAYSTGNDQLLILKTDMLVGKTDVPPRMSLWQASRKAVVMNVSDFAAKGVKPLAVLVSLGLPRGLSERDVKKIGAGLNAGAREYSAYVVGGDTSEASDLIISVSLFGVAEKDEVMLRSGAKPGDLVAVTGLFGRTSAGLKILFKHLETSKKVREILRDSVLMPHARLTEGLVLSQSKTVTAAIDSSDGLAWSLHELARASNVGFLINRLPIAEEVEEFAGINNFDAEELTLYGGEEYELVLTIKPRLWKKAEKAVKNVGGKLWLIGEVTSEKQLILKTNRKRSAIESRGWEHFKSR